MERSGGLNPSAVAGRLSVTKFTHNNWTGIKASGIPRTTVRNMLGGKKESVQQVKLYETQTNLTTSPILDDTINLVSGDTVRHQGTY